MCPEQVIQLHCHLLPSLCLQAGPSVSSRTCRSCLQLGCSVAGIGDGEALLPSLCPPAPLPGPHPLPPPQLPIVPSAKKLIYSLHYPTHRSNVRNNVTSSYWELFVYQALVLWLCSVQREIRKLATNPQSHRPENVLLFVLSFSSMYLPFCFNRIEMRP